MKYFIFISLLFGAQSYSAQVDEAKKALINFFSALHTKNYSEAEKYFTGSYEPLKYWNPAEHANATVAEELKYGCEEGGLQCEQIAEVVSVKVVSDDHFEFTVTLKQDDGTLLTNSCDPDVVEGKSKEEVLFETYGVNNVNGHWVLDQLPPYCP